MKRYLPSVLLTGVVLSSGAANAAPAPFGLEIGASCDSATQYNAQSQGVSAITDGPVYEIGGNQIDFEGLQSVTVICDEQTNVAAVVADFQKRFGGATFNRLVDMLRDEYRLVEMNDAHVGDQNARFQADEVHILVEEPHMSRTTSLVYKTEAFSDAFAAYQQQQQRRQQEKEAGQL
ncbi:hypothetical protein [Halorhodospira halophila]|uniref:Uncharacterized protein n=1 Tax=Halorhodospira halophila (strain DSM 244 / SL1) TaxID=349124 RepID=A1WUQ8_HALHL|nr:hypothetical protein [Halorhodospira halophila]ABM61420.1 hypothetical protein Hhal_0636 [Halorhodospira halophila SL1]MBK1728664.1 hypothetical protein [Halorhodospira halophila]